MSRHGAAKHYTTVQSHHESSSLLLYNPKDARVPWTAPSVKLWAVLKQLCSRSRLTLVPRTPMQCHDSVLFGTLYPLSLTNVSVEQVT